MSEETKIEQGSAEVSQPATSGSATVESNAPSKDDVVAYDTHRKLLSQRKADQARLTAAEVELEKYKAAERERAEKKLEEKGEYEKILESYKEENERLKGAIDSTRKRTVETSKLQAFMGSLPGKIKSQQYLAFVDTESIAIDPETNAVDEISLKRTVDKFLAEHSALIEGEARTPKMSSVAAKGPSLNVTENMSSAEKLTALLTSKG